MFTLLNALFEFVAASLAFWSIRVLLRDKQVKGFFWPTVVWSAVWSVNSILYYLENGDNWSSVGATLRTAALLIWCCIFGHFRLTKARPKLTVLEGGRSTRECIRPPAP